MSGHDGSFVLRRYSVIGIATIGTKYTQIAYIVCFVEWVLSSRYLSPLMTQDEVVRDNPVTTCRPRKWSFVCIFL